MGNPFDCDTCLESKTCGHMYEGTICPKLESPKTIRWRCVKCGRFFHYMNSADLCPKCLHQQSRAAMIEDLDDDQGYPMRPWDGV